MSCHTIQDRFIAGEAHELVKNLQIVVDRRRTSWEALYLCPETGELWEETAEGRYDYMVLIKVTKEYAQAKYIFVDIKA